MTARSSGFAKREPVLRIGDHRELQAAVLALKALPRSLDKDVRKITVSTMNPEWRSAVEERAVTRLDRAVLAKGARIQGGNPPTMIAASSNRRLTGGMVPSESNMGVEFGSRGDRITTYNRRSPSGGTHRVRRHTARQLPRRNVKGRVVFAAARELTPRFAALWVQYIVRRVHEAFEGR